MPEMFKRAVAIYLGRKCIGTDVRPSEASVGIRCASGGRVSVYRKFRRRLLARARPTCKGTSRNSRVRGDRVPRTHPVPNYPSPLSIDAPAREETWNREIASGRSRGDRSPNLAAATPSVVEDRAKVKGRYDRSRRGYSIRARCCGGDTGGREGAAWISDAGSP